MRMLSREIDTGMAVIRRRRDHTVMVTFSSRRFKTFLFAARKKLRRDHEWQESELFVNENITQYNFSLLILLKTERRNAYKWEQIASPQSFHLREKYT